jgi:hypothetical protein
MFASITAQSPPLAYFPASQRVTYLYYLGRYLFANNLFFPAQTALQAAYDQCHRQATSQRHLILTYLIPCNIILGRFPSRALLQRPEAQGLAEQFEPLCRLITRGDYLAFRQHLSLSSQTAAWFARKGILLTLRNRCEILVWRSFARKVFIHGGFHGDPQAQAQRGPPPYLYLNKAVTATHWLQSKHGLSGNHLTGATALNKYGSQVIFEPTDSEYAGLSGEDETVGPQDNQILAEYGDYIAPDGLYNDEGHWQPSETGQLVDGEPYDDYGDCEVYPYADEPQDSMYSHMPSPLMREIESIFASLLTQGLMRGYLTHRNPRFAIPGARLRGALPTGFPNVWQTIFLHESEDPSVPGWVQPPHTAFTAPRANGGAGAGAGGGGRVVNLSGARPVGVQ